MRNTETIDRDPQIDKTTTHVTSAKDLKKESRRHAHGVFRSWGDGGYHTTPLTIAEKIADVAQEHRAKITADEGAYIECEGYSAGMSVDLLLSEDVVDGFETALQDEFTHENTHPEMRDIIGLGQYRELLRDAAEFAANDDTDTEEIVELVEHGYRVTENEIREVKTSEDMAQEVRNAKSTLRGALYDLPDDLDDSWVFVSVYVRLDAADPFLG